MNILLITPNFFNYHKMMIEELEAMGHTVDWFDDRPSTNGWIKAVIRVKRDLIHYYIKLYFAQIEKVIKEKNYDRFLLISGQSLSFDESMIKKIRNLQPQAQFVLYQWDSIRNFPYIERMQKYFDRCYSFDRNDVGNNKRLIFKPLFYGKRFEKIGAEKQKEYKYDFSFVGTAHPQKYRFVKEMSQQLSEIFPKQFIYYYFPSRIVFFYRKVMNPELKHAKYSEFHFESLSGETFDEVYANSKCILDSTQAGQIGLTMRAIEALGAKKKLITTNADIVNYDFYRPENVYVYNGTFDFSSSFFTKPYVPVDEKVYESYSLKNWLSEILNI